MLVNLVSINRIEKLFQSLPRCVENTFFTKMVSFESKKTRYTVNNYAINALVIASCYCYCQKKVVCNIYQTPSSHLTDIRLIIDARMCTGYV